VSGEFVISLDFELLWGVRDHATRESYGANILGGREAIPRILELFERYEIAATWATVGLLMAESRDELMASLPPEELRPRYTNPSLSNYSYLNEVGEDERSDPHYYGMSLVRRIRDTPKQEIATHTHTHIYCLEEGQTIEAFDADLSAALRLAADKGIPLQSIVFPRNQFSSKHLSVCLRQGIDVYRGNPTPWAYRATDGIGQTPLRRALRLADAHSGILGAKTYDREGGQPANVPASQFLRPKAGKLAAFHPAHIRTIKSAMTSAARQGRGYHLWWHPHNFGRDTSENLDALEDVLKHFLKLKNETGFVSNPMESFGG
tara:strand:- start:10386 stop:11342 length:957 start_codon:yes stop_codon:yes gene_type:complete